MLGGAARRAGKSSLQKKKKKLQQKMPIKTRMLKDAESVSELGMVRECVSLMRTEGSEQSGATQQLKQPLALPSLSAGSGGAAVP